MKKTYKNLLKKSEACQSVAETADFWLAVHQIFCCASRQEIRSMEVCRFLESLSPPNPQKVKSPAEKQRRLRFGKG